MASTPRTEGARAPQADTDLAAIGGQGAMLYDLTLALPALVAAARRVVRESQQRPQPDGLPLRLPPSPEAVDALAEALRPFGGGSRG